MSYQQNKFENPARLAELNPKETLVKIGLCQNDVVCDIGAGSGIFTIPAAKITNHSVFALDINDNFLEIIKKKAENENLVNIKAMKVTNNRYDIEENTVDLVILVTVLHEIKNKDTLFIEIRRIMKSTGKLAIIEFHKQQTPMGPPVTHRIGKDEVKTLSSRHGFNNSDEFNLGENFYCIILNN